MHARAIRAILLAIPMIFSIAVVSGCLVGRSKYTDEQEARKGCEQTLDRCRQEKLGLEKGIRDLQQRLAGSEEENKALLEELATLHAEREEYTRKVSTCQQQLEEQEHETLRVTDTYKNLIDHLSQEIHEGKIRIDQSETRLKLNLVDKVLFPSGSAKLTDKGKQILNKVGFALREIGDRRIMIEGHTDDVPLSPSLKKLFDTNWELSALRATAVVRYLQEQAGIDPRLLAATGYSMYRPYRDNDTAEGRQSNRRIEIVLAPLSPDEMQQFRASPDRALVPGSTTPPSDENR